MKRARLILVGGFLGAGKTTLLWQAARRLADRGQRVGLITNDQAPDLVDTTLLLHQGLNVREVAGSCFCCNFRGLIEAAESLRTQALADVILAEPVGSCTDLSATIAQPLKDRFAEAFVLSPLSVLADPIRLREVLTGPVTSLHPSAAYIARKQLEEADWIVVNKLDLLSDRERTELRETVDAALSGRTVWWLSAQTGEGVDEWLRSALAETGAGRRIAEVDYDTYAEGEAVLGWLNAAIRLSRRAGPPPDWRAFCEGLLERLRGTFRDEAARVAHVKLMLTTPGGHCMANLTRSDAPISIRGQVQGAAEQAGLVLNARVEMPPPRLEKTVRDSLAGAAGSALGVEVLDLRCLSPARPQPTYRYDNVV